MKSLLTTLALPGALAILMTLPVAALAGDPVVHEKDAVVVKATIDAIDHDTRMITLKGKDGETKSIYAGPEIRRFEELKVGDEVTIRTTESTVFQIRKPGESAQPSTKDAPVIVRNATTGKPSGTKIEQETKTVTVKEVDAKKSSVTIQTEDGKITSFKVEDSKLLKGVNAGDRVVITYTKAMAISVE